MSKPETGKQRRARLIQAGKCTACGKRKPRKDRRECKTCADYYAGWAKDKARPKAERSGKAVVKNPTPAPAAK